MYSHVHEMYIFIFHSKQNNIDFKETAQVFLQKKLTKYNRAYNLEHLVSISFFSFEKYENRSTSQEIRTNV